MPCPHRPSAGKAQDRGWHERGPGVKEMSPAERRAFLLHGTRTAKLATVRRDGRPQVAPVWFVLAGADTVFNTWHTSVKGLALRRDPRVALLADDEDPPFSFVL